MTTEAAGAAYEVEFVQEPRVGVLLVLDWGGDYDVWADAADSFEGDEWVIVATNRGGLFRTGMLSYDEAMLFCALGACGAFV